MTTQLRTVLVGLVSFALLVAAVVVGALPADASAYNLSRVNSERAATGLPGYTRAADLDAVAQRWSQRMAATGNLAHNPNLSAEVGNWNRLGENVGYGGDEATVHTALMKSPGHRANILNRDFSEIGIGVTSSGGRVWVTQVFRRPVRPTPPAAVSPIGSLDGVTVAPGTSDVNVRGWTIDPDTAAPTSIHVYVDGGWAGAFTADSSRPDVASYYPAYGDRHGYATSVRVGDGTHQVCVYAINVGTPAANPLLGCRQVTLHNNPFGSLDLVQPRTSSDTVQVAGWAIDPNTPQPTSVHVYVDGGWGGAFRADAARPDVARAFQGAGEKHGFSADVRVPDGQHRVCVYAINLGAGTANPLLGCRSVTMNRSPIGSLDVVRTSSGQPGVLVAGWTIDPDTPAPTTVHAYVDGRWGGAYPADQSRRDVASVFPSYGDRHGFSALVPTSGAVGQVCVYAINVGPGSHNPLLGCR